MFCMSEQSTIQPVWRAWLCFFVSRPGGAGEVLRLDLLDVELCRTLAHGQTDFAATDSALPGVILARPYR